MSFTTKKNRGFTLFEILVAITVGSILMIGLFNMLKSVIDARTFVLEKSSSMQIISKTISLIDRDIRCKIGDFSTSNTFGVTKLSFETTNSLKFAGSVLVKVSYYIENEEGKHYLVREESNEAAGEDMTIRLTALFKKIAFKFYFKGDWVDSPSQVIKIYLYAKNGAKYIFTARGMM